MREGHFKWWDTHPEANGAYPPEELVPGFKCAPDADLMLLSAPHGLHVWDAGCAS